MLSFKMIMSFNIILNMIVSMYFPFNITISFYVPLRNRLSLFQSISSFNCPFNNDYFQGLFPFRHDLFLWFLFNKHYFFAFLNLNMLIFFYCPLTHINFYVLSKVIMSFETWLIPFSVPGKNASFPLRMKGRAHVSMENRGHV